MEETYVLWGILSAAFLGLSLLWSVLIHPRLGIRTFSSLGCFTACVFVAGVLFFIPVHHGTVLWEGKWFANGVYGVLRAAVDSMRLFLLAIDYDTVTLPEGKLQLLRLYGAFLWCLAPMLTFTNVLSVFHNIAGALHLQFCVARRIFVFSELSVRSLAMAKDLRDNYKGLLLPVMVFANAGDHGDASPAQMRGQARALGGICLTDEVAHLRLFPWGRMVTFFLTAQEESVNLSDAGKLAEKHKHKKRRISVYVYASSEYADHVLDVMDKGKRQLHPAFVKWLEKYPEDILTGDKWMAQKFSAVCGFSVRRLDPVDMLVKEVLTADNYGDYKKIAAAAETKKKISVAILGMGSYGTHFLKTAVWFYQAYGRLVQFHVFDMGQENGSAKGRLQQSCPELVTKCNAPDGDARYDICFHQVDCLSEDFSRLVSDTLSDTDLVFIALGDDDTNITMATRLRSLLDRHVQKTGGTTGKMPFIYAVIYDDMRLSNLRAGRMGGEVTEPGKNFSYDISFVGTLAAGYSYKSIEKTQYREEHAVKCHMNWLRKEGQLHWHYDVWQTLITDPEDRAWCEAFVKALNEESANIQWGDGGLYEAGKVEQGKPVVNREKLREEVESYMNYSYFRNSSIARAEYAAAQEALTEGQKQASHFLLCACPDCQRARITEHMRWNAYMRAQGTVFSEKKDKRAKTHHDLIPWEKLPVRERYKD